MELATKNGISIMKITLRLKPCPTEPFEMVLQPGHAPAFKGHKIKIEQTRSNDEVNIF